MNKPEANKELIPVREYIMYSRRGFPVSVQYIYRLIKEHKTGIRESIPFEYVEIDKGIWIKK